MAASIPLHHFLTRKCNSNVLVHAILGIRPPPRKLGRGSDSQDRMDQDVRAVIARMDEENGKTAV